MDLPFGQDTPTLDVLIVGAGLSGLTSALKILSKDKTLRIKILEEQNAPGGQLGQYGTRSIDQEQNLMIGSMNMFNDVPRWQNTKQPRQQRCWDIDRGITSLPAKLELKRYINMLDLRMKRFRFNNVNRSQRTPTMETHICRSLFFNKSRLFMANLVELVCGVQASEVQYDEFMTTCSSCGGVRSLIELYFEFPSSTYEMSSKKLIHSILSELEGSSSLIICDRRVKHVRHFKNYVEVEDNLGDIYIAEAVILAVPWNKVEEITFEPELPVEIKEVVRPVIKPRRLVTQFQMRYDKSLWTMYGYSGHFLNSRPLVVGHESRPTMFVGYILHSPEDVENVQQIVLDLLAAHYGEEMQHPKEYKQTTHDLNVTMHSPLTRPWHRVIWSSSAAVGTYYRNLMGGAVESGLRAAVNSLFLVRPQVVSFKDLQDLQVRQAIPSDPPSKFSRLFSCLNLYNVTFYSGFIVGLLILLTLGYQNQKPLS